MQISVFQIFKCPLTHGTTNVSDDDVADAKARGFRAGSRFGLMMLAGAGLTILGLFMIANGVRPTLALAALVVGIVIMQTEPNLLMIREHRRSVIANRDAPMPFAEAQDRLRTGYVQLATTNVVLTVGVAGALLAF